MKSILNNKFLQFIKTHKIVTILTSVLLAICIALTVLMVNVLGNGYIIGGNKYAIPVVVVLPDKNSLDNTNTPTDDVKPEIEVPKAEMENDSNKDYFVNNDKAEQDKSDSEEIQDYTVYESINSITSTKWSSVAYGIDVSSHNGFIDWKKVKNDGIDFAMIRCGYRGYETGKIIQDKQFEYNIQNAYKNGISVGVYFYSTAISEKEALQEAAWVCSMLKKQQQKGIVISYPVAYDFEEFYNKKPSRAGNLSKSQLTKNTIAFLNYVASAGYNEMLYASKSAITSKWDYKQVSGYDFWLAHYCKETTYKNDYAMWQYTSKGKVNGIKNYTDLNISYYVYSEPSFAVRPKETVSVYSGPNVSSGEIGIVGTGGIYECKRTLVTGWSEIVFNGYIGYVKTDRLKKVAFEKADKTVSVPSGTKLYRLPVKDDALLIETVKTDTTLKITGTYNTWYRAKYKDKEIYFTK